MAAIENLMKRWGFVRLSRYGLVLTPEGRIMSLRPDVLDDGMGGKIVGWRDRDLAAAELSPYGVPAAARAVASPVAVRVSPPIAARTISPLTPPPVVHPVAIAVPLASPTAALAPKPAPAANYVAPAAEPEEDEWEWEIALARARAAAEEVQAATPPSPIRPSTRRTRQDTVPPPPAVETAIGVAPAKTPSKPKFVEAKTLPMAGAMPDPIDAGEWPKTEPLGNIDYDDRTSPVNEVARAIRIAKATTPPARIAAKATPAHAFPRAPSPVTVIPVPKLPRAAGPIEPVVARTRFPKATPATIPGTRAGSLGIAPPPPIRPADDDKTSPGITIPEALNVAALPRIPSIVKR